MKAKLIHRGLVSLCAALALIAPQLHAGIHVWSGAGGASWNSDFNWSSGGKPTVGEVPPVILVFPPAGAKLSTNDIPGLVIDQMQITGNNYRFGASGGAVFAFNTNGTGVISNAPNCNTTIGGNLVLNSEVRVDGNTPTTVTFLGAITGEGGLRISGPTTTIAGNPVNSFTGTTFVDNGLLQLSKSNGPAIIGDLVIGITIGANNNEVVRYLRNHQVADAAAVELKTSGLLDLNGFSDTVGEITFSGGEIETGAGLLTLNGNVLVKTHDETATISGRLSLGSRSKTFEVQTNATLDVLGTISGAANVGFGKAGPGVLILSESNSFTGPVSVSAGTLGIFDPRALGTDDAGTTVQAGAGLELAYTGITTGEEITLHGHGVNGRGALLLSGLFDETITGRIVAASETSIAVSEDLTLTINGQVSGSGSLHKIGPGTLNLAGNADNNITGALKVKAGKLELAKNSPARAVAGALEVLGDGVSTNSQPEAVWLSGSQLAGAALKVVGLASADLNGNAEQAGALEISGGTVYTGAATLGLHGPLNVNASYSQNGGVWSGSFHGKLHLGNAMRTFHCSALGILTFHGDILGGASAGILRTGPGTLHLAGSNSFGGACLLADGFTLALDRNAFGSTASGTVVSNGATIGVGSVIVVTNEPLVLQEGAEFYAVQGATNQIWTNGWMGPITLNGVAEFKVAAVANCFITGPISGVGGVTKTGEGRLTFSGSSTNSYFGATLVESGTLALAKTNATAVAAELVIGDGNGGPSADTVLLLWPNQIADSAPVTVNSSGQLNLNNALERIGSLAGSGLVNTLFGALTMGGNNFTTVWSGQIGGAGFTTLVKEGNGQMTITSSNSYLGRTFVNGGKLVVQGALTSTVLANTNGLIGGSGAVGSVFGTNGIVSPGAGSVGVLETKNVTLNSASSLRVELKGTTPGTGHDQLKVVGTLVLANCGLDASLGFGGAVSNQYVIVDNDGADPVIGTFAGLPQGGTTLIGGAAFAISYVGGDGNDVVLTQLARPPGAIMSGAAPLPNGQVQVNGQGIPGTTYQVFAATNFNVGSWKLIGTATPNGVTGQMSFTDTNALNFSMRFYQFVLP
jgi:fibronectin-binding autotransporter adhesin